MVGRNDRKRLDQLIDEVARGERQLTSISDAKLREAVRLALRLHEDAPVAPDPYAKRRIRARVMAGLEPRRPTLLDNAWTALELLARPAPYIARGVAVVAVVACMGMGALVASADTLPDDLFYPVKLATEQVRLTLADAPGDRASVELSIAAHRLSEAEQLAGSGRTSDALVASALYSQHIASAAAEIAAQPVVTDLGSQLQIAFNAQRDRAQSLATTLATDVKSARGAQILALIATPTMAPGLTNIEQVATTAASVAQQLAAVAVQAAADNDAIATPAPSGTADRSPTAPVVTGPTAAARATTRATPTETQTVAPTASATRTSAATSTAATGRTATATTGASATSARTSSPAAATSAAASTPAATKSVAGTTGTTTSATTGASAVPSSNARTTPAATTTRDPRASDAAKAAREAAEKAKAAAEKLKEALKERESKRSGK